jgi:hypothetical protein
MGKSFTLHGARRSSSEIDTLGDRRNYMGHYGTFEMDSIHGRLFEMQVYVESLKVHMLVYFAFVLISMLLWPIAALLAIPVAAIAGKDKLLQMFEVILVLASAIGFALWLIPSLIIYTGGGIEHFKKLIFEKELNFLDVVDFFLSETMLLLTMVFSWIYHEISADAGKMRDKTKESWQQQQLGGRDYGLRVTFRKAQLQRLRQVAEDSKAGEPTTPPDLPAEEAGEMPIEDLVSVLEALPGWLTKCLPATDHLSAQTGEETGLVGELASLAHESAVKKIWPIDIWLTRTQFYPEVVMELKVGLIVAWNYTKDMIAIILQYILQSKRATIGITLLAVIRTLLPRIWLSQVLGGKFWPTDALGEAGMLVLYSSMVTFVVSFIWLGLFYLVVMEYRRTLCQVTIISAMVDARTRVTFSQSFLMSGQWFGMGPEECEAVLAKLPLLDLRVSSNVAAFWRLREYTVLDRCSGVMAISVLLEMVIIWLFLKFLATYVIMIAYGGLPSIMLVTLFDLVVFGGMSLFALQLALTVNSMMEQHKKAFVEAKYAVTMALGNLVHHTKTITRGADADDDKMHKDKKSDLELARRLLTEYLDMTNESDSDARDAILLGQVVTPSKVISSLLTGSAMVGTLLAKAFKSGAVEAPPEVEEAITLPATAHAVGTSLVAMYKSAQHFLAHQHQH